MEQIWYIVCSQLELGLLICVNLFYVTFIEYVIKDLNFADG